ncbi:MAG: hypothetical protein U0324_15305 [Polyangiales bacterium]
MSGSGPAGAAEFTSDLWVDEAIWGHRLHDEQTPWMVLLELLGVLAFQARQGKPFQEDAPLGGVAYEAPWRMALRNILFNNPFLEEVERRHSDDDGRWNEWLRRMADHTRGLTGAPDLTYLRKVFPQDGVGGGSFKDFARVVTLLRTTAIEADSNKRWSSKFAFPYGPAALLPDLGVKRDGSVSMDRRFFGRTGELAYLMLCRSGRGAELYRHLERSVFAPRSPWNRLVARLQPPDEARVTASHTGYLPHARLPDYEQLADDLLAVLRLQLPGYDALPHLVNLLGLHLVLYYLRRAAAWVPDEPEAHLVLEIIAPKRTTVRDLSVESFQANNLRGEKAVDRFITERVERSDAWREACAVGDDEERRAELAKAIYGAVRWWEVRPEADRPLTADPAAALQQLRDAAVKRHREHVAVVHTTYAQAIGLASRRGTRRMRYAPSDHLLQTLVLAVVPKRMEFQKFLAALWERYRMVVGYEQARGLHSAGDSDKPAFDENALRLEMRLASLGLLRRLSDACAYVENPMEVPS